MTLNGEEQTMSKTAKTNDEVRLDICARSFWMSSQKEFFETKDYTTRIMEVNQGSFEP